MAQSLANFLIQSVPQSKVNDEIRMTKPEYRNAGILIVPRIRASSFFRISSFVIRHFYRLDSLQDRRMRMMQGDDERMRRRVREIFPREFFEGIDHRVAVPCGLHANRSASNSWARVRNPVATEVISLSGADTP